MTPEQQFSALALRLVERLEGVERALPAPNDFAIRVWMEGNEDPATTFLGNVFHETRELSPEQREAALARFLRVVRKPREADTSWEQARERLLPMLRAANVFARQTNALPLVARAFAPCLTELLVVDDEHSMQFVTHKQRADWAVTDAEVFTAAHRNLAALATTIEPYAELEAGLWSIADHDAYDTSRALNPIFFAALSQELGSDIAWAIPHRDLMVFCATDNVDALARLIELAQREYDAAARSISFEIYRSVEGVTGPLTVSHEHPLANAIAKARVHYRGGEYNEQKAHLEASLAKAGAEVFVAEVSALESEVHGLVSYCVWPEEVDSLLPETELVFLAGGPEEQSWSFPVKWADLMRIADACFTVADIEGPRRHRSVGWPDAGTLDALRAAQVAL